MKSLRLRARRRIVDNAALLALGAIALSLMGGYLLTFGHLLLRGGHHLVAFSKTPVPLSGSQGETGMRVALAAVYGASLSWALLRLGRPLIDRSIASGWLERSRTRLLIIGASALLAALFLRDHLPPFLISLPRETATGGGIGPQLFNSVYLAVLSTAVTFPLGLGAAIYLVYFARSRALVRSARVALDALASLPSIVYGLFGFLVFVVKMRAGYSLWAGACILALLNLPLVVGIIEENLRALPRDLTEASLSLGATTTQTILRVALPSSWPGIVSAMVLAIGRVFAESAPLIMTAGTTIARNKAYSLDPMRGGETLAVHLWYLGSAGIAKDRAELSAGTAATLIVLVLLTNLLASRVARAGQSGGKRLAKMTR